MQTFTSRDRPRKGRTSIGDEKSTDSVRHNRLIMQAQSLAREAVPQIRLKLLPINRVWIDEKGERQTE